MRTQNSETQPVPAPKSKTGEPETSGFSKEAMTPKSKTNRPDERPAIKGSVIAPLAGADGRLTSMGVQPLMVVARVG